MKANRTTAAPAVAALVLLVGWTSSVRAALIPVTGWAVHNGTSTAGGTPASPTFSPGDNLTLMAPFGDVVLANDGDFVQGRTTLTLSNRTANTGVNALNTQLRVGLFNGPAGAVAANDVPNVGLIIEYTNAAAGGLIREQSNAAQTNPFTSPTNIGNGVQDTGADSIQGANPGPVTFDLKLTRNSGKLDLVGSISGSDSVTGNPYLATYTVTGFTSATFQENGTFTFNRIGLFLGGNADATTATLSDSSVTTIPEPAALAIGGAVFGGLLVTRRRARSRA
jgi:hypothetical protein